MEISDIRVVQITPMMMDTAREDADKLKVKWGRGTRAATEDRDITGSLAHQAVEMLFEDMDRPYQSTRTIQEAHGDSGDIFYETDVIDVKGTHGTLDRKYFYNKQFLVFDKELAGIERKGITHFIFTLVDVNEGEVYVFGTISLSRFMEISTPVKLQWDNHAVKANQLKPFIKYINRV